jgi:thiosulfate/3-mercaptopyruvate sulfurtransferase
MSESIVSAAWLSERLEDPNLTIVDCRFALMEPDLGRQQYETEHIPGAYYLDLNRDLSSPVSKHGGRHPLPDPDVLATKLSNLGITPETLVVAYDDSRFAFAARLWWLLRYLGHDRVALLDGGFSNWKKSGYPVTSIIPNPKAGQFVPKLHSDWVVDIDTVKAKQAHPKVAIVDSREPERYRGEREPIDPIAGHIPGAVNYPWQDVTTEQGEVRSPEALRNHLVALQAKAEILVYCGSGVTACVNLFALNLAGIDTGKLYAGSWSDWCSYLQDLD